jgi:hypothetical protein
MAMVADSIPKLKGFLRGFQLSDGCRNLVLRMMMTFILHSGRMSCSQAAGALPLEARNKAQLSRFLRRPRWRQIKMSRLAANRLLSKVSGLKGRYFLIFDATTCTQQGTRTENTYSTANRKRRPKKGRRYGKNKHAPKRGHSFTFALLIAPNGTRIPWQCPHYTREYCETHDVQSRTTAELVADLIREIPLPKGADVVVLADTAYDAKVVQAACAERSYTWIVPSNPERRLAGPKGKRPLVRSLLQSWSEYALKTVKFAPQQGRYAAYRRLSSSRSRLTNKPRTFYVHSEKREVQSVGQVQLVFSTTEPQLQKATPDDVKILMTNDLRLRPAEVVELYTLRWQIELFFKELKSTLGMDQYRFRQFAAIEGWVELAVLTMLYLEEHRLLQLSQRKPADADYNWWYRQRTHGLCQKIRLHSQQADLEFIADRLETDGGTRKLKRLIAQSIPREFRGVA